MIARTLALAVALALSAGCGGGGGSGEARPPERAPLEARIAGCTAARAGPVCEVPPDAATLRLWVPAETGALTVTIAGSPATATEAPHPGGRRVSIPLPAAPEGAARALEVCVATEGRRACRAFETQVVRRDERLQRAIQKRAANDPRGALAALAGIDGPESAVARAESLRARIALARGDAAAASAGLAAGMEKHLAAGRISDGMLDAFALAHTLVMRQHAFGAALVALDRAAEAASAWDEGAAQLDYYRALALRESGRPREALAAIQRSGELAAQLDLAVAHRHAREVQARLLQSLGRHAEAMRTFEQLATGLAPDESPCTRALLLAAWSWSELSAMLAGALPRAPPSLRPRLTETRRLFTEACPRPSEADSETVNLAIEALLSGDLDRAEQLVRELSSAGRPQAAYVEVWRLDIAGRVALGRQKPRDALAAYDALAARARAALSPEPLLRALVGRGRALAALGRRDDAARAYAEAEDLLDQELGHLPAGEERALFLDEQGASATELVEVLVAAGKNADALAAARRARSRNVRQALRMEQVTALAPAERARFEAALARYREARATLAAGDESAWQRPKEADREARAAREAALRVARDSLDEAFTIAGLAPPQRAPSGDSPRPAAGEAWLLLHPLGDRSCRVLAATTAGVRAFIAQAAPSDPKEALAAALLQPLEDALAGVKRLRVLASGAFQAIDVHALPLRGRPLAAQMSVAYSLDLPPSPEPPAGAALVVANPEEDLPQTEREAALAEARLRPSMETALLTGGRATKQAFADALGRTSWLHFAGHARYAAGWDTGLRLAEGVPFTVRDALALPRAPARVVLSGCETARSVPTRALDLGLPEAFVVRGSEEVVAAMRPVADQAAADLMNKLYSIALPGEGAPPVDLAAALARAQHEAWERGASAGDWAAYRTIVR